MSWSGFGMNVICTLEKIIWEVQCTQYVSCLVRTYQILTVYFLLLCLSFTCLSILNVRPSD